MNESDAPWWERSFEKFVAKQARAAQQRRGEPPLAVPISMSECADLLRRLEDGTADWYDVHRRLIETLRSGRVWDTREWKELRGQLIKSECAQCGSAEGPFTLHHLLPVITLTEIARDLQTEAYEDFRSTMESSAEIASLGERLRPDGKPRLGCPFCGGTNLRERKRNRPAHASKTRYVCETQQNRLHCNREFEEAVLVQRLRVHTPAFQRYRLIRKAFAKAYPSLEANIYRTAAIIAIEQFARYMSGADTATFCKRCAYLWDKKGMRLCQGCRDGWHTLDALQCNACASGTHYVICKVCGKNRHLAKYPTCYTCPGEGHVPATPPE